VTPILRRFIASLRHLGFGARLLILFLMNWTTVVMDDYRVPSASSLSFLAEVRVPLGILSLLLVAHSFSTLRIWNRLHSLARMLERFAPGLVLLVVCFSAGAVAVPMLAPSIPFGSRWLRAPSGLEAIGAVLASSVVPVVFVGASFLIADVLLFRLIDHMSDDPASREKFVDRLKITTLWIFGTYFACCLVFAYNAMLDTSPTVTQRSAAVGVTSRSLRAGIASYEVWWLNFRSWTRPGQTEFIIAHGDRDGYVARAVWDGMPLLLHVRAGSLGMPWVEAARIDQTELLERLVREIPTAAAPRKALITGYMTEARWSDARRHVLEYQALYPTDQRFVEAVLRSFPIGSTRHGDRLR